MRVVQAEFGDCFLLEYGSEAAPRFLLDPPDLAARVLDLGGQRLQLLGSESGLAPARAQSPPIGRAATSST